MQFAGRRRAELHEDDALRAVGACSAPPRRAGKGGAFSRRGLGFGMARHRAAAPSILVPDADTLEEELTGTAVNLAKRFESVGAEEILLGEDLPAGGRRGQGRAGRALDGQGASARHDLCSWRSCPAARAGPGGRPPPMVGRRREQELLLRLPNGRRRTRCLVSVSARPGSGSRAWSTSSLRPWRPGGRPARPRAWASACRAWVGGGHRGRPLETARAAPGAAKPAYRRSPRPSGGRTEADRQAVERILAEGVVAHCAPPGSPSCARLAAAPTLFRSPAPRPGRGVDMAGWGPLIVTTLILAGPPAPGPVPGCWPRWAPTRPLADPDEPRCPTAGRSTSGQYRLLLPTASRDLSTSASTTSPRSSTTWPPPPGGRPRRRPRPGGRGGIDPAGRDRDGQVQYELRYVPSTSPW